MRWLLLKSIHHFLEDVMYESLMSSRRFQIFSLLAALMSMASPVLADSTWLSRREESFSSQQLDPTNAFTAKALSPPRVETESSESCFSVESSGKGPDNTRWGHYASSDLVEVTHCIALFKQCYGISVDSLWRCESDSSCDTSPQANSYSANLDVFNLDPPIQDDFSSVLDRCSGCPVELQTINSFQGGNSIATTAPSKTTSPELADRESKPSDSDLPVEVPINSRLSVPASPAAVDKVPGTGALGRWLGISADSPLRLGGVWASNTSTQLSGGKENLGGFGLAQQLLLDLSLNLEQSLGWPGASIWVQGLLVNANETAFQASGSVQGSNSLLTPPQLDRTEIYSYALKQSFFDDQFRLLIGKLAPSNDFANVAVPVAESFGSNYWIPGISSLTYTPLYAMPTLIGRLPGYPNSALGASILLQPNAFNKTASLKIGVFDGRGGTGVTSKVQTGLVEPALDGPLFFISELGGSWSVGNMAMPGAASIGYWQQGGPLGCGLNSCLESSADGIYFIAQQRAINFRYPTDNSGISAFLQAGWSPSRTNLFTTSIGGGLTMFAPMRSRPLDSYGFGLSWARINEQGGLVPIANESELMLQVYGQFHLFSNLYLTPSITMLPIVGTKKASAPSMNALLQLVALF